MHWITAVAALRRDREPGVLVTVLAVRGHAPREAGAKMVVGRRGCWGSVGGGNLEQSAVLRARELIAAGAREPETDSMSLTEHAPARYGVQCCGGEVSLLFEPLLPVPAVAIFGMGHVGSELARILARHDVELHLVDSRARHVEPERLAALTVDAVARVHTPPRRGARAGARRAARGQPRAAHDPRPRRGRRAVRRRAALRAPRVGRADRVVGEVAAVREEARRRGARSRRAGPDHHADRAAGHHRQGPGDHRRQRGRGPGAAVRASGSPARADDVGRVS